MITIAAGAVLGAVAAAAVRRGSMGTERRLVAYGLFGAALVYVLFALPSGQGDWLLTEVAGAAAFGALAWLGLRGSPWFLAGGWLLHVFWDIGLHGTVDTPFVPSWYPRLCLGFDVVVSVYTAWRVNAWAAAAAAPAPEPARVRADG